MIVKELDRLQTTDKRLLAGYAAEKQLAFYLRRAFEDEPKILVINGLRLQRQGDTAQIDHLVLHSHGLIIIESKSVTTRVQVNAQGEWSRWTGKQWQGMPSPLLQAKRQAEFLRKFLSELKGLSQSIDWQNMPIDLLIAISDQGMINRPGQAPISGVCKAERITEQIRVIIQSQGKGENLLNWLKVVFEEPNRTLKDSTLTQIAQRLVQRHVPKGTPSSHPHQSKDKATETSSQNVSQHQPVAKTRPTDPQKLSGQSSNSEVASLPAPVCRHCQQGHLKIAYGKYGYYFKCLDCDRNTNIQVSCDRCQQRAKLRKQKLSFFVDCESCGTSRLFFKNLA